jgi:hypothetical protein
MQVADIGGRLRFSCFVAELGFFVLGSIIVCAMAFAPAGRVVHTFVVELQVDRSSWAEFFLELVPGTTLER